jgi:CheY-like chemotaxis protein
MARPLDGLRVFLVEPDDEERDVFRTGLARAGADVATATTAGELDDLFAEGDADLVVADFTLVDEPEAAARRIAEAHAPLVAISDEPLPPPLAAILAPGGPMVTILEPVQTDEILDLPSADEDLASA